MKPSVGIVMGSDSDLQVMSAACVVLDELAVTYETTIVSAHRTPARSAEYASTAASRGLSVIIAGAGGAAHLPGVIAAMTDLPVVGVPVRGSSLEGLDSLLSIVQMPRGVPVATVGINNAKNAGLLAARIIALGDSALAKRLSDYRQSAEREVVEKSDRLESLGYAAYLKGMK